MFADRARIQVAAGAGGDGAATFRREAHVPRGGPDGGDGGHGGEVALTVDPGMTSLGEYRHARHFRAEAGGRGGRRKSHGRNAKAVVIAVPPGTIVRTSEGDWLGELIGPGDRLVVARGGRGGRGNVHFATATRQAPTHAEKGTPGEERWLELELRLIADIGLVGAPNAGKSTLLAALTAATPAVGDYAFTTLSPNLGVLELSDEARTVIADLPGLIDGAHAGRGLGGTFLRHVDRTRVLVAVVDAAGPDPLATWRGLLDELRLHDPALLERPMLIVATKLDLAAGRAAWPALETAWRAEGQRPIGVCAHDGTGLERLRTAIGEALTAAAQQLRDAPATTEVQIHRFDPLERGWQVQREGDALRIRGRGIEQLAARTDFENEESRERFERVLDRLGIEADLRRLGAQEGTTVRIGVRELEWSDER